MLYIYWRRLWSFVVKGLSTYLFIFTLYLFIYLFIVWLGGDVMLWVVMLCYLVGFVEFVGY